MMEVSLCPFAEGTLQTVSCSCLNEKVAGDVHIVQGQCPWKHKGTGQHSTDITSGKKGTHNKAGRHGAIRSRLLFLMPFARAQRQEYWHVLKNKNSKRQNNLV